MSLINDQAIRFIPDRSTDLKKELEKFGVVCVKKVEALTEAKCLAASLGSLYVHPHSKDNGVTVISNEYAKTSGDNSLGFSEENLYPHTDRSGVDVPPRWVILWFEKPAQLGGDSIFANGEKIFNSLCRTDKDAAQKLLKPNSIIFKSEAGLLESSIFSICGDGLKIRFRNDSLIFANPEINDCLSSLRACIDLNSVYYRADSGDLIVVDNHRWLHGRTMFVGERTVHRILINE
jgi:alpha-ketoglutarate-dependent taurine dioxygenase